MKLLLICLAIACVVGVVHGIVCPANFCDNVRCNTTVTAENCNGVFKPNGGFCGCCPACVQIIPPGGNCLGTLLAGAPPTAECVTGTSCQNNTCQAIQYNDPLVGLLDALMPPQ